MPGRELVTQGNRVMSAICTASAQGLISNCAGPLVLLHASVLRDEGKGAEYQSNVSPEGPVRHVEVIKLDHLCERNLR